jgi:hypothetical protein
MRHAFVLAFLVATPVLAQTPLTGSAGLPTSNTPPLSGTAVAPGPAAGPPSGPTAGETPAPAEGRRAHAHHARRPLAERFAEANTTHDGHLTLAQAQDAHMNAVARDFGLIDKQKRGYVTLDEIKAFRRERRAARARTESR